MANQIQCPKCNSTQITANRKGFSGGKAIAGAILTGGVGLLAGTIGSKKIVITCLNCGKSFAPGQGAKQSVSKPLHAYHGRSAPTLIWDEESKKYIPNPARATYDQASKSNIIAGRVFFFIFLGLALMFFSIDLTFMGVVFLFFTLCMIPFLTKKIITSFSQ